jgi:hypothetical protein
MSQVADGPGLLAMRTTGRVGGVAGARPARRGAGVDSVL